MVNGKEYRGGEPEANKRRKRMRKAKPDGGEQEPELAHAKVS